VLLDVATSSDLGSLPFWLIISTGVVMPLFICRWQNGDFSAVSASSREEAIELLDEVGNADVAEVFAAKRFMVHFQLKQQVDNLEEPVPVDFEGFGEETYDMLCERVYPVYSKASMGVHDELHANGAPPGQGYKAALKVLNDAVAAERMRNYSSKSCELSDDTDVAELQKQIDMPRRLAERAVKERRRRAIAETPPSSKKVQ
jgi:hypothetical protein